jgi:hypothetical protein
MFPLVKSMPHIAAMIADPLNAQIVYLHAQAGFFLVGRFAQMRAFRADGGALAVVIAFQADGILTAEFEG